MSKRSLNQTRDEAEIFQKASETIFDQNFEGKIYTFYSINLRYSFTSPEEIELEKKLKRKFKYKENNYNKWLKPIKKNYSAAEDENTGKDKKKRKISLKVYDEKITEYITKLFEFRRNANLFLASKEYNYFARHLEIFPKTTVEFNGLQDEDRKKLTDGFKSADVEFLMKIGVFPFYIPTGNVKTESYYVIEDKSDDLKEELNQGILLSIFRNNLKEIWLDGKYFKVYEIDLDKSKKAQTPVQKSSTPTFYMRLSKLGVLEIRKEEVYASPSTDQNASQDRTASQASQSQVEKNNLLRDSMRTLVGYEDRNTFRDDIIADLTFRFCELIEDQIHEAFKLSDYHLDENDPVKKIRAKKLSDFPEPNPYIPDLTRLDRQRYMVIVINNIENISSVRKQDFIKAQASTILEGRFLNKTKEGNDKKKRFYCSEGCQ